MKMTSYTANDGIAQRYIRAQGGVPVSLLRAVQEQVVRSTDAAQDVTRISELRSQLEPEPQLGDVQFRADHYSEHLFTNPRHVIDDYLDACNIGRIPPHDTFIGTGLSGSIAAGILASATNRMYAVVRKDGVSSHSCHDIEGRVGSRWLFVDDFIGTSRTRGRVFTKISEVVPETTFIGSWLYVNGEFQGPSYR